MSSRLLLNTPARDRVAKKILFTPDREVFRKREQRPEGLVALDSRWVLILPRQVAPVLANAEREFRRFLRDRMALRIEVERREPRYTTSRP